MRACAHLGRVASNSPLVARRTRRHGKRAAASARGLGMVYLASQSPMPPAAALAGVGLWTEGERRGH